MVEYLFFCMKRESCPKFTRDMCPGQTTDDMYMTTWVDGVKVLIPGFNRVRCNQEEWQKKLNQIRGTPEFVMQPKRESGVRCLGNKENRHMADLVKHHADDYLWVCPVCFEEFQIIPKSEDI